MFIYYFYIVFHSSNILGHDHIPCTVLKSRQTKMNKPGLFPTCTELRACNYKFMLIDAQSSNFQGKNYYAHLTGEETEFT